MRSVKTGGAESFEDLRIWQEARHLVGAIYMAIGNGTPAERDWGFRDQIQRAVISIMNNIAEGFEKTSRVDFARLLDVAKGSAGEVRSMLYLAQDLRYITVGQSEQYRELARNLSMGISALITHLRKTAANG